MTNNFHCFFYENCIFNFYLHKCEKVFNKIYNKFLWYFFIPYIIINNLYIINWSNKKRFLYSLFYIFHDVKFKPKNPIFYIFLQCLNFLCEALFFPKGIIILPTLRKRHRCKMHIFCCFVQNLCNLLKIK